MGGTNKGGLGKSKNVNLFYLWNQLLVSLLILGVVRTKLAIPSTVIFLWMVSLPTFALKFVGWILFFKLEQIPPGAFPLKWTASLLLFSSGE